MEGLVDENECFLPSFLPSTIALVRVFLLTVAMLASIGAETTNAIPNCSQAHDGQCYDVECGQGEIEFGPCVNDIGTFRCVWPSYTECPPSEWHPCNCGSTSTPGCFLAGTLITLADGSQVPIEQVQELDSVLSLNDPKLGLKSTDVIRVHEPREVDHYFIINGHLEASSDQPVLSDGDWVQVRDLEVGMMLSDASGMDVPVESIARIDEVAVVYNIAVATGRYIANGVIVHNKDEGPLPYSLPPCWGCGGP